MPTEANLVKNFPAFESHDEASCFNCDGDFGPSYWFKSGSAQGRGAFVQHCEKCRMSTWYDLIPPRK